MKGLWVEQSKKPYIIQYNLYTKSEASNLPSGAVEQAHRAFISSLKTYYYGSDANPTLIHQSDVDPTPIRHSDVNPISIRHSDVEPTFRHQRSKKFSGGNIMNYTFLWWKKHELNHCAILRNIASYKKSER